MSKVQFVLLHLSLSSFIQQSPGLIEIPPAEPNLILETEAVIRSTITDILSMLSLKTATEKPKLKRYGILHNYFTSVALKEYNSLKEVTQLTRANSKNIDNTTLSFIAMINGILNAEGDENNTKFHGVISEDAAKYLESYLKQLNYFENIVAKGPRVNVNEEVAKILTNSRIEDFNITKPKYNTSVEDNEDYNNMLDANEFWRPHHESRRIFNGRRTHIKTFPFLAVVLAFNVFQCSGSIVHSDLVLTAASYLQLAYNNRFYRENPAFISVRIGTKFHDGGGEQIPVLEIFFHPMYNPRSLHHNLAIIRLVRLINFKSSRVKKIAIDTEQMPLPSNTRGITLIGWGAKSPVNVVKNGWNNRLAYTILDVYYLQDCMDIYSREYVTHMHFCAGFLSKGGGACNRDIGGPGVSGGILRGVVSFGSPQCGTPDAPTVFTKVGYYADWIETIAEQDVPRGRQMSTVGTVPWTPPPPLRPRSTKPTMIPVSSNNIPPEESYQSVTTTTRPISRQNKKVDMQRFKDFLRTMFDSKEIDDYINQFINEKGIERQQKHKNLATETIHAAENVTKNVNFEPETEKSDTEDKVFDAVIPENVNYYTDRKKSQKEVEADKELERDIMELINSDDMKKNLINTALNDSPSSSQLVKNKSKNNEVKRVVKRKGEQKLKKHKKNVLKKKVPSVEFLYLSHERELKIDPIYNKVVKNNSEPDVMIIDKENEDNDIEDLVTYNGEDTAEIAKKLEAITLLPEIPDVPQIPEIPEIHEIPGKKININFKSENALDKIAHSNFISKNLIFDIINEVMKSETKVSK